MFLIKQNFKHFYRNKQNYLSNKKGHGWMYIHVQVQVQVFSTFQHFFNRDFPQYVSKLCSYFKITSIFKTMKASAFIKTVFCRFLRIVLDYCFCSDARRLQYLIQKKEVQSNCVRNIKLSSMLSVSPLKSQTM